MAEDNSLLTAAGRIADGDFVDWASITSTLPTEDDRALAEELALVAHIAAGHRQLHQLLPIAPDTPANLVPDRARWGHLDLLNVLGRGSYGTVYRAWDTRLERLVALKLFHGAANPDAVMQEGRMLARMRDENVVSVYGADVFDGVAGIWMELVHGRTLDNIIKANGPLLPLEAAAVGADIAKALATVHAAGLLHCDVKAQNVVRENGGRVVLMDLGAGRLAPEMHDGDQVSDVAGTPRYMAPELFHSGAIATRASDIYSFGVLLYYLLSARFPVDGKTLGEMRRAHQEGKMRPLGDVCSGLPADLLALITNSLDRDPARRPESAADMQSNLAALANVAPAETTRATLWWAAVPTLAVLALAALLWSIGSSTSSPPTVALPPPNSLAVMPIRNLTGDPSKQFLADGLTEVLIAHLARVTGLNVASSASIATLRDSDAGDKAIAEKLGVRYLLAGSVLQADDRIRLSVRLDDPHTGRAVWGTELERQPSNILTARSEIASLVAARLSLAVPVPTKNESRQLKAEAQEAFLRGVVEIASFADTRMLEAQALFDRAVSMEPAWADPLAYLAYTQQQTLQFGEPSLRAARAETAKSNALRAIELDPSLPMSYTALAAVQAYNDWDLDAAEASLRQGLAIAPRDGTARSRLSLLLASALRLDEAVAEAERARSLDPLLPERHGNLGIVRYYARDFSRALDDMERAVMLSPAFGPGYASRGRILAALGRFDAALDSLRRAVEISPNPGWVALQATVAAQAGRVAETNQALDHLRALEAQGNFASIDNYAYIAGYQGRMDEAFRLLNEAITRRMTNVLWLSVDPRADVLRNDPRFDQAIARIGVVAR